MGKGQDLTMVTDAAGNTYYTTTKYWDLDKVDVGNLPYPGAWPNKVTSLNPQEQAFLEADKISVQEVDAFGNPVLDALGNKVMKRVLAEELAVLNMKVLDGQIVKDQGSPLASTGKEVEVDSGLWIRTRALT